MFSLNLSWNFENGAALDRTVRYILCLQAGVGLYLGVGFYHTLRLGFDVGFLSLLSQIKFKLGVCICIVSFMQILS